MYSSPNFTTDDIRGCRISKAFFDATLHKSVFNSIEHFTNVDLNVPAVDEIDDKRCNILEIIDCLNCYRHTRFNAEAATIDPVMDAFAHLPAYILVKKVCPNADSTWGRYDQVMLHNCFLLGINVTYIY